MAVLRQWLPPGEAEAALQEEPRRFREVFKALERDWKKNADLEPSLRSLKSLEWLSLVRSLEVERYKGALESSDVNKAVSTLLEIVLASKECLASRARWGEQLVILLTDFARKITLTIPWRPFYDLLAAFIHSPGCTSGYSGPLVRAQEVEQMVTVARRARRFYPVGAAEEIWEELRPQLHRSHQPDTYVALGFLALMMPTRQVRSLQGDWNSWMAEWMEAWESIVHSHFWDALWLTFFSRLAKHDNKGAINWEPYLPRIFSKCLWSFQVPVGTASASPPFGRRPPDAVGALFHQISTKRSPRVAKLLIWLLGRTSGGEQDGDEGQDIVLVGLERLGSLLEQYFHPSNNGKWTGTLAVFLDRLTRHLMVRVYREQSPNGELELETSDEEDEELVAVEPSPRGQPVTAPRAPLSEDAQRRVATLIVKLASKAQYAKDADMVNKACACLLRMSVWVPDLVLPIVHERFQMALEAVTAAHQLAIAVHTLGSCARVLLMVGLETPQSANDMDQDDRGLSPRVVAAEAIAAAMHAVLPGIDANDEKKTKAVFRFYCLVLSSIGELKSDTSGLPIYKEEWLDELLARLFGLLTNLDSPQTRGDSSISGHAEGHHDAQSFLLNDDCMYKPMLELLLSRLSPDLRTLAIKRIARFVTKTTLPSVAAEASILCEVAGLAAPKEAVPLLLEPLLSSVKAELPSLRRAASEATSFHISKVQESSLRWQLTLLQLTVKPLGACILPFKQRLMGVLDTFFNLPSQSLAEPAATFLSWLLVTTASYYILDMAAPTTDFLPGTLEEGVPLEAWISIDNRNVPRQIASDMRPAWHCPSKAELELAEELLQTYFLGAAQKLDALCRGETNGSRGPDKEVARVWLHFIQQSLNGVQTCLPDFKPSSSLPGIQLSVHAKAGAIVGSSEMRLEVAESLLAACRRNFSDPEVQQHLMEAIDDILSIGCDDHTDYTSSSAAWKTDDALLHEERTAFRLHKQAGKWRVLRPRFMQVQRAWILLKARAAESTYRPQTTDQFPKPPLEWLPPIFKDLCVQLLRYALQNYKAVATNADAGLRHAIKRYPSLIPAILPTLLSALGGLPLPSPEDVRHSMQGEVMAAQGSSEDLRVDAELVAKLAEVAVDAASQGNALEALSAAEQSEEEAKVGGAISLLASASVWRACTRHLQPNMALTAALLASAIHRSSNIDKPITNTFVLFVLRYLRPAGVDAPRESGEHLQLLKKLLLDLGAFEPAKAVHWRFSLMANGLSLMLLPPKSAEEAGLLAHHFFKHISNQLTSQRTWAASYFVLLSDNTAPSNTVEVQKAVQKEIREGLAADPQWGTKFLELFSHVHPTAPPDQISSAMQQLRAAGKTKEDMLVKVVMSSILKNLEWPRGRPQPAAVTDGTLNLGHMLLISALATAVPEEMSRQFQQPLSQALEGVPQGEERPMTLMAIEALTGLICSGTIFGANGLPDAWAEWVQPLLMCAISAAPLDFGDAWAAALRYCVVSLSKTSAAGFELLLKVLGEPPPAGASSVSQIKWLKTTGNVLCELSSLDVLSSAFSGDARVKRAGQAFQGRILAALPELADSLSPDVRRHAASCIVVLAAHILQEQPSTSRQEGESPSSQLQTDVQEFLSRLVEGMEVGAKVIAAIEGHSSRDAAAGSLPGVQNGKKLLENVDIARLGTGLQVINQSLRGGEGVCGGPMRSTLLRMLPALLKVQEMAAPELQPLALEAKSAAAVLKYLPVFSEQIPDVISALEESSRHEQWPVRAAALVYAQYFWFRHIFQMAPAQSQVVQQIVVRLMRDKKLEVQELAADTLSGMLKGLSEADFGSIRADLLAQMRQLFPAGQRRAAASKDASAVTERHAVVLGLKAFVLCTPYDVPQWLPEVLMALVQASTQPAPIKSTVRKTLGEFKRTHEQAGLSEVKRLLTDEQWESIQGIASPASYYA